MTKPFGLVIFPIIFYSCVFNCDNYLNKKIKPLFINGIVIGKSEKNCFGEITLRYKNNIDTLKDICTCTPQIRTYGIMLPLVIAFTKINKI